MKFRKLLGGGLLAAVLALGGVAGLATRSESEAVKAEGVSGTMTVDMTDGYWAAAYKCNLAMYFYEGEKGTQTPTNTAWSNMVYCDSGTVYAEIPYSLTFTPSYMILVRLNNEAESPSWSVKWNQSDDLAFANNANFIVYGSGTDGVGDVAVATAYVASSESSWGNKMNLSGVKLNDSGNVEYYSDSVSFIDNETFKIVRRNAWYGDNHVELSDFVKDKFNINTEGGDDDITCLEGGTYSIYFDAKTGHIYINDPVAAAADAWAQKFIKGVTCDGDGSITKDEWSTLSGSYAVLDGAVKKIFEDIPTRGKEDGTYAESAVARYDYILIKYGIGTTAPKHTDFMGRFSEGGINQNVPTAQAPISVFGSMDNSTPIMLVVIISVVSLTAVGGYIFLKRRKED